MQRTANEWLDAYAVSHQNRINKRIHWVCVPAIVVSVVALFWSLPVPQAMVEASPWLNWGTLFMAVSLVYYLHLSVSLAAGMLPVALVIVAIVAGLDQLSVPLWATALTIFVLAWIGQFIGHKIEGQKPSFLEDLKFLMIGPLWILAAIFRRVGLKP